MDILWKTLCAASAAWLLTTGSLLATTDGLKSEMKMEKSLNLTHEWDKVFPKSDKGDHKKVLLQPLRHHTGGGYVHAEGRRGQAARYCRQRSVRCGKGAVLRSVCAENGGVGFLTIAFDPSHTGESGGMPRYVASPDINTEDFCAAVDFLSVQENVDPEHIGIIGICGWGGMAINAAAIDTRIKATACYDHVRHDPCERQRLF